MNENSFVAVGRIERIMSGPRGLTLVIGGTGPVKALVAVELRDAALIKVVTTQVSGFAAGDVVSIGGRLEYDGETHQNVAIASPDRVSRIARAAGATAPAPAGAPISAGLFGSCSRSIPRAAYEAETPIALLPLEYPLFLGSDLVCLKDVPL